MEPSDSQRSRRALPLSPSALSAFFECQHHTWQEMAVARGERGRPGENEMERLLLERRGREHEARVLDGYRARGREVVELAPAPLSDDAARARAEEATIAAMERGAEVIYQGVLRGGGWSARPDFLVKVALATRFGDHGYEVVDAKLARHVQARAILQLCSYTELLSAVQRSTPERFWIAVGDGEPRPFRCADYLAYYRRAQRRFESFVRGGASVEPYPEPVEYCDVCRYWKDCEERRREDDHPSLVAGITRRQRDRLASAGIRTVAELGTLDPATAVEGIDSAPLARIREQARLQLAARHAGRPAYELLLEVDAGAGLERLPEPTPGDLFLDLEGDAYVRGGLEYLFGWVELGQPEIGWSRREAAGEPRYHARWAVDATTEREAFEAFVRRVRLGQNEFPELHVFHFGHREVDALKRLSCRHGSMEEEVDALLRGHVFVDLHSVLRQSVRAGVEGYTLKHLEKLYGFERGVDRRAAARAMQLYGFWLETGEGATEVAGQRALIEGYNREDVLSTWRLRDWLEARRPELEALLGRRLARPSPAAEAEAPREGKAEAAALSQALRDGLPADPSRDTDEQSARRLLAELVSWHWRELKSAYWEYYRAKELAPSERREDRLALDGLEYEGEVRAVKRSLIHRYRFPPQEHAIRSSLKVEDPDAEGGKGKAVNVVEIGSSHVLIKREKRSREPHPRALIPGKPLDYRHQEGSLWALARSINARGLRAADPEFASAVALLSREPPACGQQRGAPLLAPGEDTTAGVVRLTLALESGVLAVQGPPGSGKTHRAAAAIVASIRAGRRVAVSANSHQVIVSLLRKCVQLAAEDGTELHAHHLDDPEDWEDEESPLPFPVSKKNYADVLARLRSGALNLVGGTTFVWAREDCRGAADVLVVDEAAQVSLANVLAAAPVAPRLMLFGDPAQLEQPQRGVHPPGAEASALSHVMGEDRLTMPEHLGVFLPHTRRLHPDICAFSSKVFYEGRLEALPGLEIQRIEGGSWLSGSGLRWLSVQHRGNTNQSEEEVAAVSALLGELLAENEAGERATFHHAGGQRPLEARDILVVAPYNAQVAALRRALPGEVRVGTVDKFQGQEAPIVVYSLTSSSGADAPRGLEFLYSLNRLNVATSRARALVVLVASPELFNAQCKTPRQLQLVSALCTYLELVPGAVAPG